MMKSTDKSAVESDGRQNTNTLKTLKTLTYQSGRKDCAARGLARADRTPEGTGKH